MGAPLEFQPARAPANYVTEMIGGGWQQLAPTQVASRVASRAEILRILPAIGIAQPLATLPALVTISGEVARPGRYFVQPGTPLSAVLSQAGGLTPQAYVYGTVFTRDSVRDTQRKSYRRAISDLELSLKAQPLAFFALMSIRIGTSSAVKKSPKTTHVPSGALYARTVSPSRSWRMFTSRMYCSSGSGVHEASDDASF